MEKQNKKSNINKFIVTLFLLLVPSLLFAAPVYKDEFLCIDTTVGTDWSVIFPQVSLTGNNKLIQVNLYDTLSSPWERYFLNGYNIFDKTGTQLQPFEITTPFQVNDSFLTATAVSIPHSNENSFTMTPSKVYNTDNPSNNEQYLFIIDSSGQQLIPPKCLNCDNPNLNNHLNWEAYGNINNNSKVGLIWNVSARLTSPSGFRDSIFIRVYDFETDSLSPLLNPLSLPLPEIDEPGYSSGYRNYTQPKMAIADDGSFVVAWVSLGDDFSRVLFAIYNSDFTPRTQGQMADCSNTWADTANCTGVRVNYTDISIESDGDFYITWSVYQQTPYADVRNHVWVRGFNSDGTPKYDPVRANDSDSLWFLLGDKLKPNISCDDFGNVLVSWDDARDYPGNYLSKPRNIYVQKVDPSGNLVGINYRVNNHSGGHRSSYHSLGLNNSGQAMVSWDYNYDSLPRVVAELIPYNDIGTFVPGDINYDRSADISDLVNLVNYMFVGTINSYWPRSLTDFNASGVTDISDLVYLISFMFQNGPAPITPDEGIRPNPGKFDLGG